MPWASLIWENNMILIPPQLTHFKIFKFRFPTLYLSFCEYISPSVFFLSFFFSPSVFNQTKFCLSIRFSFYIIYGPFSNYKMEKSLFWFSQDIQTLSLLLYSWESMLALFALFLWLPKIAMPELPVNPTRTATLQPLSTEPLNECVELNPIPIL